MDLTEEEVARVTALLSIERLSVLTHLTGSLAAAIDLHQETLRLGASLMSVIATVEIAIRNSVYKNLSDHFGVQNWLVQPPIWFQWRPTEQSNIKAALDSARKSEYAKLSQQEKGLLDGLAYPRGRPVGTPHLKRAKDRRKHITVSEGKVIAELTLYFWKRLYGPDYEQNLWRTSIKRTFPDKRISRADVANNLERIYQSRNRIAHHEPVLHRRFSETVTAIKFIVERLDVRQSDPNSALAKLIRSDLDRVEEAALQLHDRLAAFRQ
jgi:hypothetical protein